MFVYSFFMMKGVMEDHHLLKRYIWLTPNKLKVYKGENHYLVHIKKNTNKTNIYL